MLNEILLPPGNIVDGEQSSGPSAGAGDGFRQESRALKYLAAVWALRMIRRRPVLFRSQAGFADEHQVLALTGLPESLIGEKSSRRIVGVIRERLATLEAAPVPLVGPLFENTAALAARLRLEPVETALLLFAVVLRGSETLDSIFDALGNVTRREMIQELANALGHPPEAVRRALLRDAPLVSAGLLWLDAGSFVHFSRKLELLDGLADELSTARGSIGRVFEQYFAPAPAAGLGAADFEHLAGDWRSVETLLRDALANERGGVNVLLYGAPGVGKTELVRAMGAALEASVFEIVKEREDRRTGRLRAYCLAQETLKRRGDCLVLFDEVEDVFPVTAHSLFGTMRVSGRDKAWTNQLLESNPVPAIWLTNTVQPIDPAFLRRFDYVAEMAPPPTPVRERLVREQLKGLDVEAGWVRRMAARERLVPSEIERAGRLARLAANDGTAPEPVFERAVDNTQRAMGLPWQSSSEVGTAEQFDFGLVNSDVDLEAVTRGLKRGRAGRIALYGPPGTGKSLFARHLAEQLGLPLVRKRASDLLSMWVGETEKQIAAMFEHAEREEAVLFLDEADSFLQDRRGATRQWEISQGNELLAGLESFASVFVAATNLFERLDPAVLRRFDVKVRLDYLDAGQAWRMLLHTAEALGVEEKADTDTGWLRQALGRLTNLAPGDFAAVSRKQQLIGDAPTLPGLVDMLTEECRLKPDGVRMRPGFR